MNQQPDCGGEVAAYVLGALEPHEAAAFELHLESCAICREELESLAGVAQALPMAAPQIQTPRGMGRRVKRAVRQASPEIERSVRTDAGRRRPRGGRTFGFASAPLALAGSGLALAVAVVVVIGLGSSGPSTTVLPARVAGISGTAELRVSGSHGQLVVDHLTGPGKGRVYEVWLERGDAAPVPASVLFTVGADGDAAVGLPDDLGGVSAVLVTSEPLGGTAKPTRSPVIVAKLD